MLTVKSTQRMDHPTSTPSVINCVKACIISALAGSILLSVVLFTTGVMPLVALVSPLYSLAITLPVGLILGVPSLVILEKYGLNRVTVAGVVGAAFGGLVLIATVHFLPISNSWQIAAFFLIAGSGHGMLASYLAKRFNANSFLSRADR